MTEPTNEQLANFASVVIMGPGFPKTQRDVIKEMFDSTPYLRERWLEYHAEFQQRADELGKRLNALGNGAQ